MAMPRYSRASSWARAVAGGSSTTVPSTHRAAPGPTVPVPIRTRDRPRITAAGSPLGSRPVCSTTPSVPTDEYLPPIRGTSSTWGLASRGAASRSARRGRRHPRRLDRRANLGPRDLDRNHHGRQHDGVVERQDRQREGLAHQVTSLVSC